MSDLHGGITILFPACGSSSPFARFFRRRPLNPLSSVAVLAVVGSVLVVVVGSVWLLVVKTEQVATLCKVGFAFFCFPLLSFFLVCVLFVFRCWAPDCLLWCSVMAVLIPVTTDGGISFIHD